MLRQRSKVGLAVDARKLAVHCVAAALQHSPSVWVHLGGRPVCMLLTLETSTRTDNCSLKLQQPLFMTMELAAPQADCLLCTRACISFIPDTRLSNKYTLRW